MTIQNFELHLISANPWQTRPLDEDHAQALAADIAEHGLLQAATGRIHPQRPEYIQLATGHHRLHAFRLLRQEIFDKHQGPDEPDPKWATFPIDVREMTDLQMATTAIAENNARKDLSAIEKAQTLSRLIREFNLSQAEAGKPFGLGQAAVANLLRLLKLPEPIQAHVQSGALPERLARQLVSIAKVFPAEAQKIADATAKAGPDKRESEFDEAESEFERKAQAVWLAVPKPKYDYKAEEAKRQARERECSDLIHRVAPLIARTVPWSDLASIYLWELVGDQFGDTGAWKHARTPAERAGLLTKALMFEKVEGGMYGGEQFSTTRTRDVIATTAKAFGTKLPQGWDQAPPIPLPAPKLVVTQLDKIAKSGKPLAAARALATKAGKAGNGGSHVHGHTTIPLSGIGHSRPAPKPSAAKKARKKVRQ
jgi:ParB-like chromosome segregation protein Spo0J